MGKKLNLVGQKFGRLTVIEESETRIRNLVTWKCNCECGTKNFLATTQALRSKNTQSCGCLHKDLLAERNASASSVHIGKRYGKLVVIEDLGMRKQHSRNKNERWSLCQCDCGNYVEISNNMLQSGWKQSCGCLSSKGELTIEQILKDNNINFAKQYKFQDLQGINNGFLRFDFCIFNNSNEIDFLIEFDGRQHENGYDTEYWTHYSNEEIKEHDKRKNEYCKLHNIILKRIPYQDLKILTYEAIIGTKYNINQ